MPDQLGKYTLKYDECLPHVCLSFTWSIVYIDVKAIGMDDYGGVYWGGSNGTLYYSEDFITIQRKLPTNYSGKKIRRIKSITLPAQLRKSSKPFVSVAGDSNSVLISNGGCNYWAYMIHLISNDLDLTLSTFEDEEKEEATEPRF